MEATTENSTLPVGELLRRERERRGLTVADVALRTRLGGRQIVALEAGRKEELPPQPYLRGFLEAYAAALGLDAAEVVRRHDEGLPEAVVASGAERLFRHHPSGGFHWRDWTMPIALVAGAGLFLAAEALMVKHHVEQFPLPLAPPPAARLPPPPAAVPELPAAAEESVAEVGAPAGVRLLLRSEGSTWAAAAADGGEERRYDLGPGQNLSLTARERLGVTLGDAGLIRLTYNERDYGFVGDKGETKRGLLFVAPPPSAAAPRAGDQAGTRAENEIPAGD